MKIESDLKANSIKQIGDELRQFTKKIEKQKILRATYEQVQIVIKELYIAMYKAANRADGTKSTVAAPFR